MNPQIVQMVGLLKTIWYHNSVLLSLLAFSISTLLLLLINPPFHQLLFCNNQISQGLDSIIAKFILQLIIKFITYDVIFYFNLYIQLMIAFVSNYSVTIHKHVLFACMFRSCVCSKCYKA